MIIEVICHFTSAWYFGFSSACYIFTHTKKKKKKSRSLGKLIVMYLDVGLDMQKIIKVLVSIAMQIRIWGYVICGKEYS